MTKTHLPLQNLIALFCCGFLATGAFAQYPDVDEKIDPSKTKTSHSESKDTQTDEAKYFDKDGNAIKTEKTTVNLDGKVKETEVYRPGGITNKTTVKTDNSGKEVQTNIETYKDGVMIAGVITGPGIWKTYNRDTGQYENWKPVKPFSQTFGPDEIPPAKTTGSPEKPTEKQATGTSELKVPAIGGQVQIPYEHKFSEPSKDSGKTTGGPTGQAPQKPTVNQLVASGAAKMDIVGTGETVGHIADAKIENVSAQAVGFYFPPSVVESKSGQAQDTLVPRGQDVALKPGETKTIALNGTCLERDKPPEPKGVGGDLVCNDGGPAPADYHCRFSPTQVADLVRSCSSIYAVVDDMAKHGAFKNFPIHDKEERKRIMIQWLTWANPTIAQTTGEQPATKGDMKEVVKRQQKDPITPATDKKIDKGVDTMWDKLELASAKAKDLEKPDTTAAAPQT